MPVNFSGIVASGGGAQKFVLSVGSSGNNNFQLSEKLPAGTYTISSNLGDTTFDVYLVDANGNQSGYSSGGNIVAETSFSSVSVIGATSGDVLTFERNQIITPSSLGDNTGAGAYITSSSNYSLEYLDETTTITGGNFAPDVEVLFVGQGDNVERPAKSIVVSSTTQLIATRPDYLPATQSPYNIVVRNPGTPLATGSSEFRLLNGAAAGTGPVWITTSLPSFIPNTAYSVTLQALDADGTVTYSLVSGVLPIGITLNSTTGIISGTATEGGTRNLIIRATDNSNNFTEIPLVLGEALVITGFTSTTTVGGYKYYKFRSSGDITVNSGTETADYLMVAAGGNAPSNYSGGGGGGGVIYGQISLSANNYPITVGAFPSGNTTFNGLSAIGGGNGGSYTAANGASGGCGGGNNGQGTAGQGFNGGNVNGPASGGGGGAGGPGENATGSTWGGGGGMGYLWVDGIYYATGGQGGNGYGDTGIRTGVGWGVGGTGYGARRLGNSYTAGDSGVIIIRVPA